MSDELADYVQSSRTSWLRHFGGYDASGSGWHFCFAGFDYSPACKLRLYTWGYAIHENYNLPRHVASAGDQYSYGRPSTEQFFGGNGQTQRPFNNIVSFAKQLHLFCTSDGRAYASGNAVEEIAENANGLGPVDAEKVSTRDLTSFQGGPRNTPQRRNTVTQIIGNGGELIGKKFVFVASLGRYGFCLLEEDGTAWFCGRSGTLFADFGIETGPLNSVAWPTVVDFTEYESPSGTQTAGSPLKFSAVSYFSRPTRSGFLALTTGGKLMQWRGLNLFSTDTKRLYEVTGFVKSVSILNGGSGYTRDPVITFSAPQHADGIRAEAIPIVQGGVIVDVEIRQPGWGYTSPPTINIEPAGVPPEGSGASITCSLFDGSWSYLAANPQTSAAIDSTGKAYLWMAKTLRDRDSPADFGNAFQPLAPRNQDPSGYTKIEYGSSGLLLTADGNVDTFDITPQVNVQPDGTLNRNYALTRIVTDIKAADIAAAGDGAFGCAVLSDSGDLYTYGNGGFNAIAGRGLPAPSSPFVPFGKVQGAAKWTKIFGVKQGFVACRDESFDEYGNRINPIPPGLT